MLRSGFSSEIVLQELSKRKFADTLDSASQEQLVQAGASQSLISTLQSGAYQLSAAEMRGWQKQKPTAQVFHWNPQAVNNPAVQCGRLRDRKCKWVGRCTIISKATSSTGTTVVWCRLMMKPSRREKFYLLFFSAIWSKEGRQFTARLVDYYNQVHPQHQSLKSFSSVRIVRSSPWRNYVSQTNMPWPAVAYENTRESRRPCHGVHASDSTSYRCRSEWPNPLRQWRNQT